MFVADDLGGWLIGLVADAARKKLIRGDELDRALRASAATAIKRTGAELSPTNLSKRQQSSTRCFTARPEPCQSGKRLRDLSVSGWAAQDLLEVGHSPLEQQDRLVQPPGRLVGGSQVAPRAEGLGWVSPRTPSESATTALAVFDGLRETVTERVQAPDRPPAQPYRASVSAVSVSAR